LSPGEMVSKYRISTVRVCIDVWDTQQQGRLYCPFGQPETFSSLTELMMKMEAYFDGIKFPQNFSQSRTFTPQPQTQPIDLTEGAERMEREKLEAQTGNKATFTVQVQFRQHATWQGSITWLEEQKTTHFRSMLEMIRLMDSALPEGDAEAQPEWD